MGLPPGLLRLLDPQYNYQLLGTLQVSLPVTHCFWLWMAWVAQS